MSCLRAVSAECAREIAAISVVSLAEEVVLVDAAGTPVFDAPVWYEPRGARYVPEYVQLRGSTAAANPAFSLFTLRWIAEQSPAARTQATGFTDMASFMLCRLAGRGDRAVPLQERARAHRALLRRVRVVGHRGGHVKTPGGRAGRRRRTAGACRTRRGPTPT